MAVKRLVCRKYGQLDLGWVRLTARKKGAQKGQLAPSLRFAAGAQERLWFMQKEGVHSDAKTTAARQEAHAAAPWNSGAAGGVPAGSCRPPLC